MLVLRSFRAALFLSTATMASTALAQTAPASSDAVVAPPAKATSTNGARIYTPADFARYAPKTAYDMLVQVPGFTIRSATQERGLGQASENVLINGQRIANKSYSGSEGGAIEELRRISASSVERIEIVEAASLGIAGLSGQVANIIVKAQKKASGQFEWNPDFRAHFSKPNLFRGNVSYSGQKGPVTYTFSVKDQAGRGAFGGPILITSPTGEFIERRDEVYHSESDLVTFQTKFGFDGPGSSVGNLTLAYTPYWAPAFAKDHRVRADGDNRSRVTDTNLDGWYYDVNADYEFALGPGRLKLIGLRHFDHEPTITRQVTSFESGAPDVGVRLVRDARIGETIGRGEYGWKMWGGDFQWSLERAFNSLDQRGKLFELSPEGEFEEVDFPGGSGKVQETRYESVLTYSRALSPKLDLQVAAGGEISKLERVDGDLPPRKFFRPKGSINLGWRPAPGWEASLKFRRKVGQISFYDFLDQPNLQQDRENQGNPDLVPPQSWELEGEIGKDFGPWGKTRLRAYHYWIEDIIDVIPIGEDGQGVGNLPKATDWGFESVSTINFDPMGWKGAKLDLTVGYDKSSVRDPLTGEKRAISGNNNFWTDITLRHDIPGTPYAWGSNFNYQKVAPYTRLTEVFRSWEGPNWLSFYVEHKNLMGLVVRAQVSNILNARHRQKRRVYEGYRDRTPLSFLQDNNQLIGPIFSLRVTGTF